MIVKTANWCDLAKHPDGRVEFVYASGPSVICEHADSRAPRWAVATGQPLLYLRAAAADDGRVCAIGQGHDDGQACVTIEGGAPFSLGSTHGVFPVLVRGLESGWACYVQSGPASYAWITIDANGTEVDRVMISMPPTSQGFLYVASDGTPITQDRGRGAIPGLALPSPALSDPRVWVGQSMSAPTLALFDSDTGALMPLNTPGGQPPHIVESGGTFYVCSYVEGGAWLSTHRRPFAAAQPPPVDPVDPVDPGEPDMAVRDVPNLMHVIERCKNEFPIAWKNCHKPSVSRDQAEEFARRAAYACWLEDRRFGLNGKRGDANTISQDCVCFKHDDGKESVIDFGGGAGGDNPAVQWSIVGHYLPPGPPLQLWIKPEPVGGQQPGPTPGPGPGPTPPAGFTFPVGVEMPEDVALSIIDRYLEGIRERDKIRAQDVVPSRGALMYLFAVFFRELSSWIVEKKRAPQGEEWWAVGDRIGVAAVKHYQDRQGTD